MLAHFAALKTLADAGSLTGRIFDTVRVNDGGGLIQDQYVILYRSAPDVESDRFTKVANTGDVLTFEWDVRAVGTTAELAAATLEAFLVRVVGQSLTVSGRSCTPLTVGVSGGRAVPDQSVKPHLFFVDASVSCVSRPS